MKTVYFLLVVFGVLMTAAGCESTQAPPRASVAVNPQLRPLCSVDLTAPFPVNGFVSYNDRTITDCSESDWDGIMEIRMAQRGLILAIDIDRAQAKPGNTYFVEDGAAVVWTLGDPYLGSCRSGGVTWLSDEPDWEVDVDVFCLSESGSNEYFVKGNLKGHVFYGNN